MEKEHLQSQRAKDEKDVSRVSQAQNNENYLIRNYKKRTKERERKKAMRERDSHAKEINYLFKV